MAGSTRACGDGFLGRCDIDVAVVPVGDGCAPDGGAERDRPALELLTLRSGPGVVRKPERSAWRLQIDLTDAASGYRNLMRDQGC